jgi:D-glycero-D-manno-heptose 1,7-bisphosphate phosphatase
LGISSVSLLSRNLRLQVNSLLLIIMQRAVFLDRDGTIVEDIGYLHEREKIRFLPGAISAIKLLNQNHLNVIVITNQAGVARGFYTEETVTALHKYILDTLAEQDAVIDAFYYCPHHIEGIVEKYRKACYCRKPNPGMIEKAANDLNIDLKESFVIGDNIKDIEAGQRAGCRTILLAGKPSVDARDSLFKPHYVASDLYHAVKWLLK